MFFITILMLAALSIAGAAAFFSVAGLANTFHGTFWSVIIMGGSLEYGKLIATSYLYRFWNKTHYILKVALLLLIAGLMVITSMGIFGYLSTGYQSDAIPLKQIEQRVSLLESEKTRLIERKQQIDNQIASLPSNVARGRLALIKGFKEEQKQVTESISQLEKDEVELKTKLIQTESHVGPIIYIAKAFDLPTDDATKYLIYLLIFVFDPMALTLTLAVNVAIRQRELHNHITINIPEPIIEQEEPLQKDEVIEEIIDEPKIEEEKEEEKVEEQTQPLVLELVPIEEKLDDDKIVESENVVDPIEDNIPVPEPKHPTSFESELDLMISNYNYYKGKIERGINLSQDENWSYLSLRDALQKRGYNVYI